MTGILAIERAPFFDDIMTQFEYHTHAPCASARNGNNDEIYIPIQQQDVSMLSRRKYFSTLRIR